MGVAALSSALESASKLHAKANAIVLSAEAKTDKCASVKVQKLLAHADRMHTLATDIRYTHIYTHIYIYMYIYIYICKRVHADHITRLLPTFGILIYMYMYIYTYILIYMYIYM
jgi:hypothetical protein